MSEQRLNCDRSSSRFFRLIAAALLTVAPLLPWSITLAQDDVYESNVDRGDVHFTAVDVWIDAHHHALGAWQLMFDAPEHVQIVGIENGDFASAPPHYDPAAMMNHRVILAQFSLDDDPRSPMFREMRLATLHLRVGGNLDLSEINLELTAAANTRGERITGADVRLERRDDD